MGKKYVYYFGDGKAEGAGGMKELLGGKGAGLAEMTNLEISVPAGFTISTEACVEYYKRGKAFPPGMMEEALHALKRVERSMSAGFGDTLLPPIGTRLIDSVPPPIAACPKPQMIRSAAKAIDWSPDEQNRLIVAADTETGTPARRLAIRATFNRPEVPAEFLRRLRKRTQHAATRRRGGTSTLA